MEAELLNKIADLELQNQQLKEVMPQAFAACEALANTVKRVDAHCEDAGFGESLVETGEVKFAERTLKWLEQFRQKEEGK